MNTKKYSLAISIYLISFLVFYPVGFTLHALPQGEQVVSGQADFTYEGDTLHVDTSDQVIINYDSFNIASGETMNFRQPYSSSVALNRVTTTNPSSLYGVLSANGKIFIINPNGILFGPGSKIDTGSFMASTLDMSNSDFINGNYYLNGPGNTSNITNEGNIKAADGGYVALFSPNVVNNGTIQANYGTVALGAGNKMQLDFLGDGLLTFSIDESTANTLIQNKGIVSADSGQIIIKAGAINDIVVAVINNEGIIRANRIEDEGGVIKIIASGPQASITNSGTIEARGVGNNSGGDILFDSGKDVYFTGDQTIDLRGGELGGDGGSGLVLAKDHVSFGGTVLGDAQLGYERGNFVIDPHTTTIDFYTLFSTNTVLWNEADLTINADVESDSGASLWFLADHDYNGSGDVNDPANYDWESTPGGDFTLNGADITAEGAVTIKGLNLFLDGEVSADGGITLETRSGQVGNYIELGDDLTSDGTMIDIDGNILLTGNIDISTGASVGGNIDIAGTIDSKEALAKKNLTLSAGSGNVTLNDTVGGITEIRRFEVSNANTVDLQQVTGTDNFTVNSTTIDLNGDISVEGTITLTGAVNLGASLATTGDNITITGNVTRDNTSDVTISSGDGITNNIQITGTIDADTLGDEWNLTIDASDGTVNLGGAVGSGTALDTLSITGTGLTLPTLEATTAVTLTELDSGGLTIDDAIISTDGAITLKAEDLALTANLTAGTGTVNFYTNTSSRTIGLGGATGDYTIDDSELGQIVSAGTVTFGENGQQSGAITIKTLTLSDSNIEIYSNASSGSVVLDDEGTGAALATGGSGDVSIYAGTGDIVATQANNSYAEISTTGTITLSSTDLIGTENNRIQFSDGQDEVVISEASTGVYLGGIGALTLGSVTTTNGTVDVDTVGDLTVSSIDSGDGDIELETDATLNINSSVTGYDITLISDGIAINTGTGSLSADATDGVLEFYTNTASTTIGLGGATGTYNLTDDEIATIFSANEIYFGEKNVQSGAINIQTVTMPTEVKDTDIYVSSNVGAGSVTLDDGGTGSALATGGDGNIYIDAGTGGILAAQATNSHGELATGGNIQLTSAGVIGSLANRFQFGAGQTNISITNSPDGAYLDGVNGMTIASITTNGGCLDVTTQAGDITVSDAVNTNGGYVKFDSVGNNTHLQNNITTGAGYIDINDNVVLEAETVVLSATGAGYVDIAGTVNADLEGNTRHLEIDAGSGDIDFQSTIGDSAKIDTLTLDTTGDTQFDGITNVFGSIDIDTDILDLNAAMNTTNDGGVTITNTGAATIDGKITSEGTVLFDSTGGITLGANIEATDTGALITINDSALTLTGDRELKTNNGAITLETIETDTLNDHVLTLTAGSGNIDIDGTIGAGNAIGGLTVETIGDTNLDGVSSIGGAVDIDTGTFDLKAAMNVTNDGTATITNTGLAELNYKITSEGTVLFDSTGAITLGADIETTDATSAITVNDSVLTLTDDRELKTNNGAITLETVETDTLNDHVLTLTAGNGNIDVDGTIGNSNAIGGLTVDTTGDTNLDGISSIGGIVDIDTGTFDLNAAMNITNDGTVTISNSGLAELDGKITSEGTVLFDSTGAITLGADIETTDATSAITVNDSSLTLSDDRELKTNNGAITLETVETDTLNDHVLTLTAGNGNIDVDGTIGAGNAMGGLTIDTTGDTNLDGVSSIGGIVDIDTGTFDLNAALNVTNDGTVTISNSGLAEIGGKITSEGTVLFDSTGAINLGADIETTDATSAITVNDSSLTLSDDRELKTNNGAITLETVETDTLNDHVLTLTAGSGNIDVDGTIGAGNAMGGLTIDTTGDTNLDGVSSIGGIVDIDTGTFDLNAALNVTNDGTVTISNSGLAEIGGKITSEGTVLFDSTGAINLDADIETTDATSAITVNDSSLTLSDDRELKTNNGAITLETVETDTLNDHVLTLTAGSGNIDIDGTIGAGNPMGGLTVDTTGDTNLDGVSSIGGIVDIDTGTFDLNAALNVTNDGIVTISNSGLAEIGGKITSEGTVLFDSTGGINLDADIEITDAGSAITINDSAVTLSDDRELKTNNGAITLETVETDILNDHVLTLTAGNGNIDVDGTIGNSNAIGGLTVDTTGDTNLDGLSSIGGIVDIDTGTFDLNAAMNVTNDGTATISNSGLAEIGGKITSEGTVLFDSTGAINLDADIEITDAGSAITINDSAVTLSDDRELKTNNGAITLETVETDILNDHVLTLTAGNGNIDVDGTIGNSNAIGGLTVDTTGDTNLDGILSIGGIVDIDTATFDLNAAMNVINDGTVTISNSGLAEIGGKITSEGTVLFDNTGGIILGANIETTDAGSVITANDSVVTLSGDRELKTNNGAITLETVETDTLNDNVLTLTAGNGNIDVDGTIGNTNAIGGLTVETTGDTNFDGALKVGGTVDIDTAKINLNASMTVTNNGIVTITNTDIATIDAQITSAGKTTFDGAGNINLNANIIANGGASIASDVTLGSDVTIDTDNGATDGDVTISGTVTGTNKLTITSGTANTTLNTITDIDALDVTAATTTLSGNISTGDVASNNVQITGAVELEDNITINTNNITNDGNVTITGNINADAATNNRNLTVDAGQGAVDLQGNIGTTEKLNTLDITSGQAITINNAVEATNLKAKTLNDTGAAITINNSANDADTIDLQARNAADDANANADIEYEDADGVVVATINTAALASLLTGDDVTQTGAIQAQTLEVTTKNDEGADITLDRNDNQVDSINLQTNNAANTQVAEGDIVYRDNDGVAVATINTAALASLIAGGDVTQTGAVKASELTVKTLNDSGADITLDNAGNDVTSIDFQTRTADDSANVDGDITYLDSNAVTISNIDTTGDASVTTNSGNITVGDIDADNAVLTANNSILDDGDTATDIKVTTSVSMTATNGDIGADDASAEEIPEGFIDVDASAGLPTMTVSSGGSAYVNYKNADLTSSNLDISNVNGDNIGVGVTSGDFTFNDGTFDGINKNVKIIADNIIASYDSASGQDINTTKDVVLRAVTGNISENIDEGLDIVADDLEMYSKTGIGSDNPIETQVNTLIAVNETLGDVNVNNTGDIILKTITNENGNVNITSTGAINDDGNSATKITAQELNLEAENGIGSGDALETEVDVFEATNNISGNIGITNEGDLEIGSDGVTNAGIDAGDIQITTTGDMILTGQITSNNGGVHLTSTSGSILDNNGDANNITAETDSSLTAKNGAIGSEEDGIEIELGEGAVLDLDANNIISIATNGELTVNTDPSKYLYVNGDKIQGGVNIRTGVIFAASILLSNFEEQSINIVSNTGQVDGDSAVIGEDLFAEQGRYMGGMTGEPQLFFSYKTNEEEDEDTAVAYQGADSIMDQIVDSVETTGAGETDIVAIDGFETETSTDPDEESEEVEGSIGTDGAVVDGAVEETGSDLVDVTGVDNSEEDEV